MFTASFGHANLLPGIHNIAVGRTTGVRSSKRGVSAGQDCLSEAVRRLDSLSHIEKEILSTQSTKVLHGLLGLEKSDSSQATFDWDAAIKSTINSIQRGDVTYSPNGRSFHFSENFLKSPSPFLISARGFKTRSSKTDKPFVKSKEEDVGNEAMFKDVVKHLNISAAEKEKVNIALSMSYAAGSKKQDEGASSDTEKNSNKFKWKITGEKGSGQFFWNGLHKLMIFLSIITCLVILNQFLPIFRFSRGANEIAPEDIDVNFEDVRGCDEAKHELQEVVEFLMYPEKFSALGGKLPKGVLLCGPPGTGKTLLARAVAGQAGVPFFHSSGSEFDEVFVGQGAKRVRDLFKAAKERAPCVIFIDEIDSIGGKRTSSPAHPYANQTINQLLNEMDGFVSNEGVIVLGATNRESDLDKAILRPGRFDTKVEVGIPDLKGRSEILELYLAKVKHDSSINVEILAKKTNGMSGAELSNLVNTATIKAAVDNKDFVSMSEFDYAFDKLTMGVDLKSRIRSKEDLIITAYHEAGHTLVAYFTQDAMPLHKVTIVAKGQSGGHTAFLPPENQEWHQTKSQMKARMDTGMGGRAAEELIFGKEKITGGASSDLQMTTRIAFVMVTELGMSEKIGHRVLHKENADKEMVDSEMKIILDDSYKRAMTILVNHKNELKMLAEALLKYETLDVDDIKAIIEHKKPPTKFSQTSSLIKKPLHQLPPVIPGLGVSGVTSPPIESLGQRQDGSMSS